MDSSLNELAKLAVKQRTTADVAINAIDTLIADLRQAQARAAKTSSETAALQQQEQQPQQQQQQQPVTTGSGKSTKPPSSAAQLAPILARAKQNMRQLTDQHKELYTTAGRYGKQLDKLFKNADADAVASAADPSAFEGKESDINRAIAMHLVRQGHSNAALSLAKEANIHVSLDQAPKLIELKSIVDRLDCGDVLSALEWASSHRSVLDSRESELEFALAAKLYTDKIKSQQLDDALKTARSHLQYFMKSQHYRAKASMIMTAAFFSNSQQQQQQQQQQYQQSGYNSTQPLPARYRVIESLISLDNIRQQFVREYCIANNIAHRPLLEVATTLGVAAVPVMIRVGSIMKDKKTEWSTQDELPMEVPLPDGSRFHSVFACPVSKDQASDVNPPMMLPCGHVISQESIQKLAKGTRGNALAVAPPSARFKCPYCPGSCTVADTQPVYF
ncbi:hypothetical protein GQ42DRAFT_161399 [Ramicandelaber brevisporus]|nr:hypothetical protein GQ42DRAFT_161399 [Ramicandelaber brevisporus]